MQSSPVQNGGRRRIVAGGENRGDRATDARGVGARRLGDGAGEDGGFQLLGLKVGRDDSSSLGSIVVEPPSPISRQRLFVKTFLGQKAFRAQQISVMRRVALFLTCIIALFLAWSIGYFDHSLVLLPVLMVATVIIVREEGGKIMRSIEQAAEIRLRRKKTVRQSETAEWVNLGLNRWWSTCNASVVEFLRDYIEPLFQDMAPAGVESLELVEFTLGSQTPFVKHIQLFDDPACTSKISGRDYIMGAGLDSHSQQTIIANLDIGLQAPDSKLVLQARLGGKRVGYSTMVYVEGLHVSGSLQAVVAFDRDAPFPHLASITATFVRPPDIWFSVRVLKGLRVMEVPLLKNWVHSFVMDMFTTLMVDPGKLSLDFMSSGPSAFPDMESSRLARGVLTLALQGSAPESHSQYENDSRRRCVLRLGQQKYECAMPAGREDWKATHSFLVHSLQDDVMVVKIKHRRMMRTLTLGVHSIPIDSLDLIDEDGVEQAALRTRHMHYSEANLRLDFDYTPLPSFSLHTMNFPRSSEVGPVAGVMYVHVHAASNLISGDADGLSDPYCILLANKKKVMTTHYILDTLNPKWERGVEIFVSDFTQMSLTFVVYDWDGPLVGDDLLGVAKLNLTMNEPEVLQRRLELEIDGNTQKRGVGLGSITVSMVFRPVSSVAKAELPWLVSQLSKGPLHGKAGAKTPNVKKVAKKMSKGAFIGPDVDIMELHLECGRNLVPKDANGLSDPYVVVKFGGRVVFRSSVVKKSLNPDWRESATLTAPRTGELIRVECWDKDLFSDDFMGFAQFTTDDLASFESGPKWCQLDGVKSGEIKLAFRKGPKEPTDWLHLDEASRPLIQAAGDNSSSESSTFLSEPIPVDSDSDTGSFHAPHVALSGQISTSSSVISHGSRSANASSQAPFKITDAARHYSASSPSPSSITPPPSANHNHDDGEALRPHSRAMEDTLRAPSSGEGHVTTVSTKEKGARRQPTSYFNISGQVIEASGLRGELDQLELYTKVRLNSRPSYQRQQRFGRGPVIHKTRTLRGSSHPQWKEDFMVKESPVPSDSLLTVDLKSSSKVNIGTHTITLDKFFDSNFRTMRWLDIGNNVKLSVRLSRQPPPEPMPHEGADQIARLSTRI